MQSIREVLLMHHTHTDIGFTHSQPVVWELHRRFIDRAVELCEACAEWPEPSRLRWTCEVTAPLLKWLDGASEEQVRRFRRLAGDGLMGAGAMWCNLTPLCDGEELVRGLHPVGRLRKELGLRMDTAINHDVNGMAWPLVGMLREIGVDLVVMGINPHFGGYPLRRPLLFRWVGADGRAIRVFNGEHYASFERWLQPESGSTAHMAGGLARYLATLDGCDYQHDFIVMSATHSDFVDNNPPDLAMAKMVRQWNDEGRDPVIRFVTAEQLNERLRQVPDESLESHRGDWPDFWNFGCAAAATETRINSRTKQRLRTAGVLECVAGTNDAASAALYQKAWDGVMLYDEHTWGSWATTWNHEVDEVAAQMHFKAAPAYDARCAAGMLMRRQLERLAGNPAEGGNPAGVLLVNPGPEDRAVMLTVPTRLATGRWQHHPGRVLNLEVPAARLTDDEEREIGPYWVPSNSSRFVAAAELCRYDVDPSCQASPGMVESSFYQLRWDEDGKITSLFDKRGRRELVDTHSPWKFFGYVHETVDRAAHRGVAKYHGRDALFDTDFEKLSVEMKSGWKPDWPALRTAAGTPDRINWRMAGLGPQVEMQWNDVPGARDLRVVITLAAERPAVVLEAAFRKTDDPWAESIYLAFPLRFQPWRAWYDAAGQVVELDRQQLPGSVRDYVTAGTWVAVAGAGACVMLACPDAPMLQVGGFHFGRRMECVPRDRACLLLAWPLNNYWDTNFPASQPGFKRFRYELTTADEFDAAAAMRFGRAAATPMEYHPVLDRSACVDGPLWECDNPAVSLTSLRRTHDGAGIMVHLNNPTGQRQKVRLRLPCRWRRARRSNALEECLGDPCGGTPPVLEWNVEPRSHALVRLET